MLGIVFTEFMDMVEDRFPPEVHDQLIELAESEFKSRGIYTGVGNYNHSEMIALVTRLSEESGIAPNVLVQTYGQYLFSRFYVRYPEFFDGIVNSLDFLERIEDHIHKEVKKLYPDANLPTLKSQRVDQDVLIMKYRSSRPFAYLAYGLMTGCVEHFKEPFEITMEDESSGEATRATFTLKKNGN